MNVFFHQPKVFHDSSNISLGTGLVAREMLQKALVGQTQMNKQLVLGTKFMLADLTPGAVRWDDAEFLQQLGFVMLASGVDQERLQGGKSIGARTARTVVGIPERQDRTLKLK